MRLRERQQQLRRAFYYLGEADEKKVDFGDPTSEERGLGIKYIDPPRPTPVDGGPPYDELRSPGEEDVMSVAERWSINPTTLTNLQEGIMAEMEVSPPRSGPTASPPPQSVASKPWWRFW